ncbi:MAG: hypothetical protein LBQ54_12150 [Planctomycetaceae bacterium]|nr:hypothetical protein [Planctomycetaceae bacterium]
MPPAANARALDPGRLTLTTFGLPSVKKSFQLEAEGILRWNSMFPAPKQ